MAGIVSINSEEYPLKGLIRRSTLPSYSPAFRTTGNKQRSDDPNLNYWTNKGKLGLGNVLIDPDNPLHFFRVIDATMDTSLSSGWRLARLNNDITEPTVTNYTVGRLRKYVEFAGAMYGFWELVNGTASNADSAIHVRGAGAGNWEGLARTVTAQTAGLHNGTYLMFDAEPHQAYLFMLVQSGRSGATSDGDSGDQRRRFRVSRLSGTTWGDPTMTSFPTTMFSGNATDHESLDGGVLISSGTTLYAFLWNEDSSTLDTEYTTDNGDNWTAGGSMADRGAGPRGKAVFYDLNGDVAPVIGTRDGVFAYDTSANVWHEIFHLPTHAENCRGMVVHGGYLYVSSGTGAIWKIVHAGSGQFVSQNVGPNRHSGLPQARQGYATDMISQDEFLFVAYGGQAASRNASILKFDGAEWYHVYLHSTANVIIFKLFYSRQTGDVGRLHFAVNASSSTTDTFFLDDVLVDPAQSGTFAYQSSGYIDFSEYNFQDAQKRKCVYQFRISAADLSADDDGEYVAAAYGTDGAAGSTTSLGNFVSGTLSLNPGTSSRGISVATLRARITANRDNGSTAHTPVIREFEVIAEVVDTIKERFEIPLDLMVGENAMRDMEARIANLLAAQESVTLVPLDFGEEAQKQVRIVSITGLDRIRDFMGGLMDDSPRDEVETMVVCEERL